MEWIRIGSAFFKHHRALKESVGMVHPTASHEVPCQKMGIEVMVFACRRQAQLCTMYKLYIQRILPWTPWTPPFFTDCMDHPACQPRTDPPGIHAWTGP